MTHDNNEKLNMLSQYIEQISRSDGIYSTDIPPLKFIRASEPTAPIHQVHEPALCVVTQGSKIVTLGKERYQYGASHYLVVSMDLPISGEVIEATSDSPYLCLRLDFKLGEIIDLLKAGDLKTNRKGKPRRGLYVNKMDNVMLLDAVLRLVQLLDSPKDIEFLAPLVIREILYRLLQDENGDIIWQLAIADSYTHRIAEVIEILKADYAQPLRIEELASKARMSLSSLHYYFKQVTGLSPLQYQKQLRLQKARQLMLLEMEDAASAGFQVGYESPSQFSREYSRLFGLPPKKDINKLRGF
nr:AraC family transcriptional regulator [Evansella caseinilytica]